MAYISRVSSSRMPRDPRPPHVLRREIQDKLFQSWVPIRWYQEGRGGRVDASENWWETRSVRLHMNFASRRGRKIVSSVHSFLFASQFFLFLSLHAAPYLYTMVFYTFEATTRGGIFLVIRSLLFSLTWFLWSRQACMVDAHMWLQITDHVTETIRMTFFLPMTYCIREASRFGQLLVVWRPLLFYRTTLICVVTTFCSIT